MKNKISKIAVVGCSDIGYEVAKDIFGKLTLGPESSVILIPHICTGEIYDHLKKKGKKVYPILNNQVIEPQRIYIEMIGNRELRIEKKNRNYKFYFGGRELAYINKAFFAVADAFKEKSIGVILYGIGGSGVKGINKIKEVGGKSVVQAINPRMPLFKDSMPYHVLRHCKVDYALSASGEDLFSKLEELLN